jgi:ribonucleotide reductase beta subunit family protein with ferritin-like domain
MDDDSCAFFHLRPATLRGIRPDRRAQLPSPRRERWLRAFPAAEPGLVEGVAALFPATAPETFARWQGLRSAISAQEDASEPLLRAEEGRFTILPLRDAQMWGFRKQLERLHWVAQEVDLSADGRDYEKVSPAERRLLKKTLGWFGPADEAVMDGLDEAAASKILAKEGQFYLRAQKDQECVHSEAYSLQIQEVIPLAERAEVFRAARDDPLVARVADWIRWWVVAEHPAADFFAAMAFIEGVLFSGFFAVLQFFKVRALFPGITTLNEFIARDEGVHTLFWAFLLTSRLARRPDPAVVQGIAREVTELSADFFADALPEPVAGLNAGLLAQYVRFVADAVLAQAGYEPLFRESNPFDFMDMLSLNVVAKCNFFEFRPTQYQSLGGEGALEFAVDDSPISGDRPPPAED